MREEADAKRREEFMIASATPTIQPDRCVSSPHLSADAALIRKPRLHDSELTQVLRGIDTALEAFRGHEGHLTAVEISLKSMLSALRGQVAAQLSRD